MLLFITTLIFTISQSLFCTNFNEINFEIIKTFADAAKNPIFLPQDQEAARNSLTTFDKCRENDNKSPIQSEEFVEFKKHFESKNYWNQLLFIEEFNRNREDILEDELTTFANIRQQHEEMLIEAFTVENNLRNAPEYALVQEIQMAEYSNDHIACKAYQKELNRRNMQTRKHMQILSSEIQQTDVDEHINSQLNKKDK